MGKISRLCSMSHNIHKVYSLCKHMKCGLWVLAIHAVANYGNLQYYLWRHDNGSNSGPCQVIIKTENKLKISLQYVTISIKKTQYQSTCTVNHSVVSLLRTRRTEFALFL